MEQKDVVAIAKAVGQEVGKQIVISMQAPEPVTDENDAPEGAYFDENAGKVVYTDPIAESCDEAEAELIKCLPKGVVTYKGRSGSQTVNHTEESLNFLNDFRKNKKSWKTRFNNR